MNDKIIEAIKIDNVDLFRLLFDYVKIFDSIENFDEYKQLIRETIFSCVYLDYGIEIKYKEYKENTYFKEKTKLYIDDNVFIHLDCCEDLFENGFVFKYLFKPSLFLDLCVEYKAYNIYNDYTKHIVLYNKLRTGFYTIRHTGTVYLEFIGKTIPLRIKLIIEFINNVSKKNHIRYLSIWNNSNF